ncbi:MAG: thiol reductant ABC exporter subunit CydD, partial [Pseudonocardiaceae bacterium]
MSTLRVAFLSAFVLELLATLAVALVAVEVGLRLTYGELGFSTALLVLLLAPEAYLPLREVGARFHASMEGVAAAEQVFAVLDGPDPDSAPLASTTPSSRPSPELGLVGEVRLRNVGLSYPGQTAPALSEVSLTLRTGRS